MSPVLPRTSSSAFTVSWFAGVAILLSVPTGVMGIQAPAAGAVAPAAPAVVVPATQPTPPRTMARHDSFLARAAQGNVNVLWVGDSITDWWARSGLAIWEERFAPLGSANFGIAGDTTNGVLWRMQNGELEGFSARLIILMLGTNNLSRHTPADVAAGDRLIVEEFRRRQPQAKVLVLGVFPRGAAPDSRFREPIRELNGHLAALADGESVFFMDIGQAFLEPDGTLLETVMPDGLHPSELGYRMWADAIGPRVNELLAER